MHYIVEFNITAHALMPLQCSQTVLKNNAFFVGMILRFFKFDSEIHVGSVFVLPGNLSVFVEQ